MPAGSDLKRGWLGGRRCRRIGVLCWLLAVAGCGAGGRDQPGAPTPTVVALLLSPAIDLLKVNDTERLSVSATRSDGSQGPVLAVWGSDAPAVAGVAADGTVTAIAPGTATIFADYEGRRATRLVTVIPDYGGVWTGTYRTTGCTETGDWVFDSCGAIDRTRDFTLSIGLSQTGRAVSGGLRVYSDIPTVPVSGSIASDGTLTLAGGVAYTISGCTQSCFFEIVDWAVVSSGALQFSGQFSIRVSSPELSGSRVWTSRITGSRSFGGQLGPPAAAPEAMSSFRVHN